MADGETEAQGSKVGCEITSLEIILILPSRCPRFYRRMHHTLEVLKNAGGRTGLSDVDAITVAADNGSLGFPLQVYIPTSLI